MTVSTRLAALDAWLADLRADDRRRRIALAGGVVAGLGLSWVHWMGLVVGGAAVGLSRRSVPRALLAALGFGALVTVAGIGLTPTVGLAEFVGLSRLGAVTVAVGMVLSVWGALLRVAL
jgi:hypothetical protein